MISFYLCKEDISSEIDIRVWPVILKKGMPTQEGYGCKSF